MLEILVAQNWCESYYQPPTYSYTVENNTPYVLDYQLHNFWYTLQPGEYQTWSSYLGNTIVDKCGYYHGKPVFPQLEVDEYPLTGRWDSVKFNLEVDLYGVMSIEETYPGSGKLRVMMY